MITGFILVSIMCLKGVHQNALIAGLPSDKVNCIAKMNEVYKSRADCEAANDKLVEYVDVDRSSHIRKLVVMPGSACVEINRIISNRVEWKVDHE